MKTLLLATLALLLTAGSCKKSAENQLPPATQTGANTFGCKINGVVYKCNGWWKPGTLFLSEGVSAAVGSGNVELNVLVKANDSHDKAILSILFACPEQKTGIYREGIQVFLGKPTSDYDSKIIVTRFDENVISGSFDLKIIFTDGSIWNITEGRFDINRNGSNN